MTSLVQRIWVIPAVCAIAAAAVPLWVLLPDDLEVVPPAPQTPYDFDLPRPPGTGRAIIAMPFSSDRDPSSGERYGGAGGEEAAAFPSPPELVGLIGRVRGPVVALVRTAEGETAVVGTGQDIAGWTVSAIGRDSITFSSGGKSQVMKLNYGNRDGTQGNAIPGQQP